ncbi:ubiquitin 60s ribosomal protein l40 fusion [Malassezia pachydermatis]|uniref:Autophagy-related protein 14 n=1 Tax=Malassezia pachydermatis TaxID=77020 RepID=A0A0M8MYS4_9BASI|nr:ubiquitin 60s ribosomal protein l40 fusion [Malassezia pachydermatis]KOS16430.1 ubiquitin 60s ribosomal protein l40 fusion [Malassezia pachydermatis]
MAAAHRRLGRIVAIHARYATQDRDTACVVVLRRKNEPPFFVTSPQTGPSGVWGEYTSVPIHPEEAFAPWLCQEGGLDTRRVLVSLWQETMPPHSDEGASRAWSCVWERTLDLRRATSVDAETFSSDGAEPRVYLAVRTDEDRYEYLPVSTPLSEATPMSDSDAGRRSYTWAELQSLVHLQAELHSATCERIDALLRSKILRDSSGNAPNWSGGRICKGYEPSNVTECVPSPLVLRDTLHARHEALRQRQQRLDEAQALLQRLRDAHDQGQQHTRDLRETHTHIQQRLAERRAELLRELEVIYPIQLVDARDLLYSIVGLPLPNGVATTTRHASSLVYKTHLDEYATALSMVVQLVLLLSTYLHTHIPYPLTAYGSRAVARDGISIMSGPRAFVLHGHGTEPYRYEYAVFLLNKDIEQLMNQHGVPVLDLRNTLPNVKNLLVTLSAGYSAPS